MSHIVHVLSKVLIPAPSIIHVIGDRDEVCVAGDTAHCIVKTRG